MGERQEGELAMRFEYWAQKVSDERATIVVEAENEDESYEKALDQAYEMDIDRWDIKDVDYAIELIKE